MAPSNLPPVFNATSQDVEMLLAAQCHLGSKNLQVHMEPYLWKTRPDGINVINIGKTWSIVIPLPHLHSFSRVVQLMGSIIQGENRSCSAHHRRSR